MSEETEPEATTAASGSRVTAGPGGQGHNMRKVTGPCLIVRIGSDEEGPDRLAFIALGEGAGYTVDIDTGLLRVWDRESTYLVQVPQVVLLRIGNVVKRGFRTGAHD